MRPSADLKAAALIGCIALAYSTRLGEPGLIDYDEACYAQVSREMLERGDLVVPTLYGEPFFEKPPFLYWTQIAGYSIFGVGEVGARALNVLGAVAALVALHASARAPLGSRGALLATLVLGTSVQFMTLARVALMDLWLAAWLLGSMAALHRAFEDGRAGRGGTPWFLLACSLAGLAALTKGLVGIAIPAAAAAAHLAARREWRLLFRARWLAPGAALALLVGGSWHILLGLGSAHGFSYLDELFLEHHWRRFAAPREGHGGSILYYPIVLSIGLFPWTPFWPMAFARGGSQEGTPERRRFLQLAAAFAATPLVLFSLSATKLPGYIAPAVPPLAILLASLLDRDRVEHPRLWRFSILGGAACWLLFGLACAAAPHILERLPRLAGDAAAKEPALLEPMDLGLAPWIGFAIGAGTALALAREAHSPRGPAAASRILGVSSAALLFLSTTCILPAHDAHFQAPLRALAASAAREAKGEVLLVSMSEAPSVAFYAGVRPRRVRASEASSLEAFRRGADPVIGIIPERKLHLLGGPGRITVLERRSGRAVFRYEPARR